MKLTTIATEHGTSAARISDGTVVALPYPDVVTVTIEGIGSCRNQFYAEAPVPGRY